MRRLLAAAVLAAAVLPFGVAHAADSDGSCLDPLLTQSAPRIVYYNPEIGMYYVDVTAARAYAASEAAGAGAVASCLATLVPPTSGCVTTFVTSPYPGGSPIVSVDGSGRVIIDPHAEDAFVAALVGNVTELVACVV
jgi:hypothetical protein